MGLIVFNTYINLKFLYVTDLLDKYLLKSNFYLYRRIVSKMLKLNYTRIQKFLSVPSYEFLTLQISII